MQDSLEILLPHHIGEADSILFRKSCHVSESVMNNLPTKFGLGTGFFAPLDCSHTIIFVFQPKK